jgi:pilus assembly protein CpaC
MRQRTRPVPSVTRTAGRDSLLRAIIVLIMGGVFLSALAAPSGAADPNGNSTFVSERVAVKNVTVTMNKSLTVNVDRAFSRVIVGAADFADVLPLSDRSIYIQAKKVGATNVSLLNADGQLVSVLDVQIVLETAGLQQEIRSSTGSRGIQVSSAGGQLVLSGVALDAVAADRAVRIAKSLSGGTDVVNAMQVAPSQQVMLEVRFLEATRSAGTALGVNWFGSNANGTQSVSTGLGSQSQLNPNACAAAQPPPTYCTILPALIGAGTLVGGGTGLATGSPFATIISQVLNKNGVTISALVTALEQKGLVRTLAEPNLIALSGDKAEFHAGGEYPVPVASSPVPGALPTVTIVFKEYGVKLIFTPTVLSRGVINLVIEPEVSELDFANAVSISGTIIPALTKRDLKTSVELRDGQSFALAGLLQENNVRNVSQIPWLGSVPVLGALFSSKAYQQNETDLVVIVTPHLVAPAVPGQRLASPLDARLPSNDVDFFLNGQPEVRKLYQDYVSSGGELTGPYGHLIDNAPGSPIPVAKK